MGCLAHDDDDNDDDYDYDDDDSTRPDVTFLPQ
jgi:hypothetical protein